MNPSCPVNTPGEIFKAPVVVEIEDASNESITAVAPELPPVMVSSATNVPVPG